LNQDTPLRRLIIRVAIEPVLRFLPVHRLVGYPSEVSLELTNCCNLSCVMCFRERMRRPKGFIEPALARRAIDALKAFPKAVFLPQGFGESLLHPEFLEILGYARKSLANPIVLITNGTLLNGEVAKEMVREGLADAVIFSVDSGEKSEYESVRRGASFEQLDANIAGLLEVRRSMGKAKPSVFLRGVVANNPSVTLRSLRCRWGGLLQEQDKIIVNEFRSWVGTVSEEALGADSGNGRPPRRRLACRQLYRTFLVGYDGNVTPCCYDYDFSLAIGNLRESTAEELWRGARLSAYRRVHLQRRFAQMPLCARCQEWE